MGGLDWWYGMFFIMPLTLTYCEFCRLEKRGWGLRLSLFTDMFARFFLLPGSWWNWAMRASLWSSRTAQWYRPVTMLLSIFSYPFPIFRDAAFGSETNKPPWLQWIFLQPEQDDATLESTLEIHRRDEFPSLVPGNYHRYGVPTRGDRGRVQWELLWMIGLSLLLSWFIMVWSYYYIAMVAIKVYGNEKPKGRL